MKLPKRFSKITKWLFAFILLAIFSCSKENGPESSQAVQQENFVGLSLIKEIAEEIKFKSNVNNSKANKNASARDEKKKIETIDEIKNEDGNTVFYVINYIEGGYVILSADNRAQPVIGFSDDNRFVVDKGTDATYPLGLKSWIGNAKKQITAIRKSTLKQNEKEKLAWKQVKNILVNNSLTAKEPANKCYEHIETFQKGPYLNSIWNQEDRYNDALPYQDCNINEHVLAGCVPIAMAQIMRYYEYPVSYNWLSMPLTGSTPTTANFILDIHNAIGSMYAGQPTYYCGATSVTTNSDMGKVLKTKFKYTSADFGSYNYQVVKSNLAEGRPVLLTGFSSAGGHMWVCDGYKDTNYYYNDCSGFGTLYFSMKWGWRDGANNGYFAFNNFNLSDSNTNRDTGFNENVKMIYNIKP